ncbi:hypothetical protein BSKO_04519 [Bryopsis sp. KO-2023]|nr:hypothetical protein BSKO_04519 [Bryopsis sp. KO-2023]
MSNYQALVVLFIFLFCAGRSEAQFLAGVLEGESNDNETSPNSPQLDSESDSVLESPTDGRFNIPNPFAGAKTKLDETLQKVIESMGEARHVYEAQFKLLKENKVSTKRLLLRLKDSPTDVEEQEGGFLDSFTDFFVAAANLTGSERAKEHAKRFKEWVDLGEQGLDAAKKFVKKHKIKGMKEIFYGVSSGVNVFEVEEGFDVEDLWSQLLTISDVEFAELDLNMEVFQSGDSSCPLVDDWGFHHSNAPNAISLLGGDPESQGLADVMVVVIDSGVDINHPSLKNQLWVNEAERDGEPGVDDDGNGFVDDINGWNFAENNNDVMDTNGHGTHVAGIIAASPSEEPRFQGISPNAKILPCKFTSSVSMGAISDAVRCLDYAAMMGADITSNSWGGAGAYSLALKSVLDHAERMGILVVAAAGNSAVNNDPSVADATYPASYDNANIISVAAVDDEGRLSSISNYGGQSVDLGAPGVSILSTYTDGTFETLSGTSMATPFVTGAAALLLGGCRAQQKSCSALEIKDALLSGSFKSGNLEGLVNTEGHLDTQSAAKSIGLSETNVALQAPTDTVVLLRDCNGQSSMQPSFALLALFAFLAALRWL